MLDSLDIDTAGASGAEYTDPHGHQWPRGKDHDDATIARCYFASM